MHTLAICVGNSEGKRSFAKPKRRGEDNIEMYFKIMTPGKWRLDICGSERDNWRAFVNTKMELWVLGGDGTGDDRGIAFWLLKKGSVVNYDLANKKNRTAVEIGSVNYKMW